jgi:trk system potassium uptake protein TrkH
MRISLVLSVIGALLRVFSLAFLAPILIALIDGEWASLLHFVISMAVTALVGFGSNYLLRAGEAPTFYRLEAMAVVAFSWIAVAVFGGLPFVLAGLSPTDAFFESMSGFTTTGATILTDFSLYDRAFFFWRGMTQWFGGLGVIALFVVILPRLGIAGRQLFFAEASTAPGEAVSPQIRHAASRLWVLYSVLTLILVALLAMCGMTVYEGFCHAFTTLAAGGFSPDPESIAGYHLPAAEWVLVVFMIIGGTSYPLQYKAYTKNPIAFLKDGEFMFYFSSCILLGLAVALVISQDGGGAEESLRLGLFQSASLISSTGYASADYNIWPDVARTLLIVIMLVSGCAGSAAGGPKSVRHVLVAKHVMREITRTIHPQAVLPIKYKGSVVSSSVMRSVFTLVVLYFLGYFTIGTIVAISGETDMVTSFSAALACLGNIGPAFGPAGPMGNYAFFSDGIKWVLALAMWIGRLEIVTVLVLLHPHCWMNLQLRVKGG